MNNFLIHQVDLTKNDICLLLEESIGDGHNHIRRLFNEYQNGVNRFEDTGEALYAASINGEIIAVCGLNKDPYSNSTEIGRVRRLYLLKKHRRNGIAKMLMQAIIDQARKKFKILVLFTDNQVADNFYKSIGFKACSSYPKSTHYFEL